MRVRGARSYVLLKMRGDKQKHYPPAVDPLTSC